MKIEWTWLITAICIIAFLNRSGYEILKSKRLINSTRSSFMVMFINMLCLWASWFTIGVIDDKRMLKPMVTTHIGLWLIVIGMIIFFVSLVTIKSLENYQGQLITHGIYAKLRHPMYFSFLLWLVGQVLLFGSLTNLFLSPPFILMILWWRFLEEKELKARFKNYSQYQKSTWF